MNIAPMPVLREHHAKMGRVIRKERVPLADLDADPPYRETRRLVLITPDAVMSPAMERPAFREMLTEIMLHDLGKEKGFRLVPAEESEDMMGKLVKKVLDGNGVDSPA